MNQTHNDNPTLECQLGRESWRQRIVDQIENSQPPKVIGVHGTWGMGKTSLLQQIYKELGGNHFLENGEKAVDKKNIEVVWFEAWQYQHESNILAVLLKEIRDQLTVPQRLWATLEETAVVGTLSLIQSISATFDNFGAIFGASSGMSRGFGDRFAENHKEYQRENFSTPLDSVMLKKQLQEAIDKLLHLKWNFGKTKRKLVIFIDDLDRCEPETAFRILESIKVYLNLNNCIFVLGMDINAVDGIIAHHYEKDFGTERHLLKNRARLYLEKICQDIYTLPTPNHEKRVEYFGLLLTKEIKGGAKKFKELLEIVKDFKILPPFPRSIKIFANVVISHFAVEELRNFAQKSEENLKAFLIITYLYAFHLEVYNLIYSYDSFYKEVFLSYCINPKQLTNAPALHPELQHLVVYKEWENQTAETALGGVTVEQEEEDLYKRMYPSEHLRQVLWIGKLVTERDNITQEDLDLLQL